MKVVLSFALLVVLISSVALKEAHQWTEHADEQYPPLTDHWTLEFQRASRNGVRQDSNKFAVDFNGERLKEWHPEDYNIHTEKIELTSRVGKNSIHFIGTGISDGLGQGIDNVKLYRNKNSFCGYEDVIINGGFEEGHKLGRGWSFFANGKIPGWTTPDNQLEVGYGRIYNPRWPADTHITELDAKHNSDVSQTFELDEWQRIEGRD